MKSQITSNTLLDAFRKQGVTCKHPTFFGKMLNLSPAEAMLKAFEKAGVARNQPSFFGQAPGQLPPQLRKAVTKPADLADLRPLPAKRVLPRVRAVAA